MNDDKCSYDDEKWIYGEVQSDDENRMIQEKLDRIKLRNKKLKPKAKTFNKQLIRKNQNR